MEEMIARQRKYFESGHTLAPDARIRALVRLRKNFTDSIGALSRALFEDLGKSETEAYMTELGMVLSELNCQIKNLRRWSRPRKVRTPLAQFKSKSYVLPSPYGVTLVMSPWNYPVMLALVPLIDALAAGNTVVVKPGSYAPHASAAIARLIADTFAPEYVAVVEGGREQNAALLNQKFDYIFFTGGAAVGRTVLEKAAQHLTPVTLELGGKSPCIVTSSANLKIAARRIAFGKFLNCGQTCVAPDYCIVHRAVLDPFLTELKEQIALQYGSDPLDNPNYGKIVNEKHYARILSLIESDRILVGGRAKDGRIEPTVVTADATSAVMQEEIFGPVLPVLLYDSVEEAKSIIARHPTPLALYVFSENKRERQNFLRTVAFGGACVNDCIVHLATDKMGFGGVGESGMGAYHGKVGFETFSHLKSVLDKSTRIDLALRYQPYTAGKTKFIKKVMK